MMMPRSSTTTADEIDTYFPHVRGVIKCYDIKLKPSNVWTHTEPNWTELKTDTTRTEPEPNPNFPCLQRRTRTEPNPTFGRIRTKLNPSSEGSFPSLTKRLCWIFAWCNFTLSSDIVNLILLLSAETLTLSHFSNVLPCIHPFLPVHGYCCWAGNVCRHSSDTCGSVHLCVHSSLPQMVWFTSNYAPKCSTSAPVLPSVTAHPSVASVPVTILLYIAVCCSAVLVWQLQG